MIQVQNLSKFYGTRAAIQDLTFNIKAGEVVGFLGPNGAGKTTTMKILTGFMPASAGTATVAGFDVFNSPHEVKRNIGYLPETPPLYPEMRVQDYIAFAARIHDVPRKAVRAAVSDALEKTNLTSVANRIIGNLSKGFKQRVGLAQALVHNPKVLILDEPTVGLDPIQIIEIRSLIKELSGEHTLILSTHILPEVTATCQRIIVINEGRIAAQDSMETLTARLKKGTLLSVLVKSPSPSGVEAIRSLAGIVSVSAAGAKLIVEVQGGIEVRDKIAEAAVSSGMGLLELSSEKLSLEEIFLKLTTADSTNGQVKALQD